MMGLSAGLNAKATCCCVWVVWASLDPLPDLVSDAAEIAVLGAELLAVAITSICCFCSEAVLLLRSLDTPDTLS